MPDVNLSECVRCAEEIIMRIHEEGFKIAMQKELQLNREQAVQFYNEHRGQPYFDELINRMTMYANDMLILMLCPLKGVIKHRFWLASAKDYVNMGICLTLFN